MSFALAGSTACTPPPEAEAWSYRAWTDERAARLGAGGGRWFVATVAGEATGEGARERYARTRSARPDVVVWHTTRPPRGPLGETARALARALEMEHVAYLPGSARGGAWLIARAPLTLDGEGALTLDASPPVTLQLREGALIIGDGAGPRTQAGGAALDSAMELVREGTASERHGFAQPPHRFEVRRGVALPEGSE